MVTYVLEDCEREIERCERIYKSLNEAKPFLKAVFRELCSYFAKNRVELIPVFDAEKAEQEIRAGRTLALAPQIETETFVNLLKKVGEAVRKVNPALKGTVKELNKLLDRFRVESPAELTRERINALQEQLIKETVLEQDLATFLFSITLSFFYRQHLESIIGVLRTDLWEGGDCPTCGELPHYGVLREDDGAKELECWLCGTRWVHTRIKCPFCDNEEQEELGYFTVEDSEICRVNYCRSCCHYYKLFDLRTFHTDGQTLLPIHNLATLTFDLLARQEGFSSGSGLEWVNDSEVEASDRQD